MQHIDEARLENDLGYRFQYLAEFMGFSEGDITAIHDAAGYLAPIVPNLVDAVYDKLAQYDATWRHFVPRQHGYEGDVAEGVESLQMSDEVIQFRKQHLGRYLTTLVSEPYDAKMVGYLDLVGAMHTPGKGSSSIDVPLVQMNALMGFVADALIATILGLGLAAEVQERTLRAFSKLLWLQNDLINRHYAQQPATQAAAVS
ncbi:MAG: hypothetical protein GXP26_00140 [Planctomycetes bacterium]|nr:hypothetical protein [Planctomycetota bacterium]